MMMGIPTMILVTCRAAFLYFGGSFVSGVGSISRVLYLGARGGALGAGSANATRGLGGPVIGEGAVSGLRGRGIVVARGVGGMMFARSLGAEVVGGITGFEVNSSTGCWTGDSVSSGVAPGFAKGAFAAAGKMGATGAGPGTGGMKDCSGSVGGGADELLNVPVALTSSRILLLVGVTGVACCTVFVWAGAALGASASFFVL